MIWVRAIIITVWVLSACMIATAITLTAVRPSLSQGDSSGVTPQIPSEEKVTQSRGQDVSFVYGFVVAYDHQTPEDHKRDIEQAKRYCDIVEVLQWEDYAPNGADTTRVRWLQALAPCLKTSLSDNLGVVLHANWTQPNIPRVHGTLIPQNTFYAFATNDGQGIASISAWHTLWDMPEHASGAEFVRNTLRQWLAETTHDSMYKTFQQRAHETQQNRQIEFKTWSG